MNSMAVVSDGSYGIEKGLVFSFPVSTSDGKYTIQRVRRRICKETRETSGGMKKRVLGVHERRREVGVSDQEPMTI